MGTPAAPIKTAVQFPDPSAIPTIEWAAELACLLNRREFTDDDRARMEQIAYQFGSAPESYDIVIADGAVLETPCGRGMLSVLPHRKYWHMPGGLLVPDDIKPQVVSWLKQISQRQRVTVAVYSVGDEELPLFRESGYEISKFGEEPYLDLGGLTWKGKDFEWVRRQTNYCRRLGLTVSEVVDAQERVAMADELVAILDEDLRTRPYARPLKLLVGEFDPHDLARRRLFVVRSPDSSRVEGFLACSPMRNGQEWSFETYRKREDAPRGTMPFLFREVIDLLQGEGVSGISLCVVPGKGVDRKSFPESHWLIRTGLDLWYQRLNFLYNSRGQHYFKSRFRPEYRNRYVCVTPKSTIVSILSFLQTVGAFSPNVGNIIRHAWHHRGQEHLPE